jgi:hypothetical protein
MAEVAMRTAQILTVSVPPEMLKQVDKVRKVESRTRSELVREALRTYFASRNRPVPMDFAAPARIRPIMKGRAVLPPDITVTHQQLQEELSHRRKQWGAEIERRGRAKLRARLREGALRNADRDREIAREWSPLEEEAWQRNAR